MTRKTLILSLLLALSLGGNILVGGLILGHRFAGPPGADGTRGMIFDRVLGTVPEEVRPGIRTRLDGQDGLRSRMQEVRHARRAVNDALRARPFDPTAADRALTDLRDRITAAQAALHRAVVAELAAAQAAGTLPPPPERRERPRPGDGGGKAGSPPPGER
ncbi:MAG: hypothetical protein RLY86_4275 [Pseudomonadota bacterium]|jgi:uncharacterized membrane protein